MRMPLKAVLVLLFLLLLSTAAFAQRNPCANFPCPCGEHCTAPADAPYCTADAGKCKVTTTYLHGEMDSFAPPDDPTTPSTALMAILGASKSQYDTPGCNRHFGDTFTVPSCLRCNFCGAKVEIHLKPCGGSDPTNDNYTIGVAPFGSGGTIASGRIWPTGTPAETTLVINLDPVKLNQLLCKPHQPIHAPLDVYLEDDVIVDWVRLTVYSQ